MDVDRLPAAPVAAGIGPGWLALARDLGAVVPASEMARLWVFAPVRREDREFGTAVVARHTEADRIRVYTARYVRFIRGRERGQSRVVVDEVAECPLAVVFDVLKGVQERMAETEPPVEISPAVWYGVS